MSASETPITDSLKADMDEGWPDRWLESHARLEQALASADTELTAAQSDPRLSRRDEWISVYERLPEVGQDVLVWCGWCISACYKLKNARRQSEWSTEDGSNPIFGVTHWQPLPEPPEGNVRAMNTEGE